MYLRYGMNPHQRFATAEPLRCGSMPVEVLHGVPSLLNFMDALNGWQLVREVRFSLGRPAAASFKHVSPAGVAISVPPDEALGLAYDVDPRSLSPTALACVRAREADPKSSFGDFVALSDPVDLATATILEGVVSDGIIAPGYEPGVLEILAAKKSGRFIILRADPDFEPPPRESFDLFGMRITQDRNQHLASPLDLRDVRCGTLTSDAVSDLLLGLVAVKYTLSNSVGYVHGGQLIGMAAGQQSRIDSTMLAGAKASLWQLRQHPKVLALRFKRCVTRQQRINWRVRYIEGDLSDWEVKSFEADLEQTAAPLSDWEKEDYLRNVDHISFISDGYIPFRDNVDRAARHGVRYIAQPGGSIRDADIETACRELGITMVHTHLRMFHH